ncbi:hypothetical protein GCM10025868_03000 [Angustibacter aerolatus]|uniref:ABC transporter domain-containing protein n=1 Tax=Angustibacter aerolatus TaxID=1162965 RepID=A0ABQ6JA30_9ACTN|nr:hypothetical protein GCM10025868_03000 [Angustibacter aerolatus]
MTGVYTPTSGRVQFEGADLGRRKKFEITRMGIARTFQNIRLFGNMTALENILVGADAGHRTGLVSALFRLPQHRHEEAQGHERAREPARVHGAVEEGRRAGPQPAVRRPAAARDRPRAGHRSEGCCASTSRRPASTRPRRSSSWSSSGASATRATPCCSSSTTCGWSWA